MEIGPGGMRVDSVKKESGCFDLHALNAAPLSSTAWTVLTNFVAIVTQVSILLCTSKSELKNAGPDGSRIQINTFLCELFSFSFS